MLIDADNAPPTIVEALLAEVATYGTTHVNRAYGDWTGTRLKGWKDQLLAQSIQPIQQFPYITGKNATDTALVIGAMDLLHTERFDGTPAVTRDCPFRRYLVCAPRSLRQVHLPGEPQPPLRGRHAGSARLGH
ncbi:NYN domain-containing protein [Nonomuraea jabiensis]|uniref:NYN domain-containing protein n=1 Tax=Nonomuraea jabiensis TaxID=882448 RepID=UPI0034475097